MLKKISPSPLFCKLILVTFLFSVVFFSPLDSTVVNKASATTVSPQSPCTINGFTPPNAYIDGVWRLTFTLGFTTHESFLFMKRGYGKMIIKFFSQNTRRPESVEQFMSLCSSPRGLVLLGYNPVYPGTRTKHPTYIPDNFIFQQSPNGAFKALNLDDAGNLSPTELEFVRRLNSDDISYLNNEN